MSRRSEGQSVDSDFFPEIHNGRSKYESPLSPILTELRRKHVVAAAATSGLQMSLNDSSDPWSSAESIMVREEVDIFAQSDTCTCNLPRKTVVAPRRLSLFQRVRKESVGGVGVCATCGKRISFDPIGDVVGNRNPRLRRTPDVLGNREIGDMGPPQHAQALLHSTPHLRHLSQASTDMQGAGNLPHARGILGLLRSNSSPHNPALSPDPGGSGGLGINVDYRTSVARQLANQNAANELASFLLVLAHEMSLENYGFVENEVFTSIFALVHSNENSNRMAGVAALDALIEAPSADEEKKAIKFANNLSSCLRSSYGDFEFLSAVSQALGHMAIRATNVDFVESEVTRALEWLRTDRSDRRLAASLTLRELAINASTAFYSKTSQSTFVHGGSNEFLDSVFPVLSDLQPIVRGCAADTLSECLKILVERHHASLTALLCQVHFAVMEGLHLSATKKSSQSVIAKTEATNHGCLLAVACMLQYTRGFILPRFDEICEAVLDFSDHPKALIRLEVIRLVPRLAHRYPRVFGRRYLDRGLLFLLRSSSNTASSRVGVDIRPSAFAAIGQLILAMSDNETGNVIGGTPSPTVKILNQTQGEDPNTATVVVEVAKKGIIYEKLDEIFDLVRKGLQRSRPGASSRGGADTRCTALHCAADLIAALGATADGYVPSLIKDMFVSGLSDDLITCLHSIAHTRPNQQGAIEERLLREISVCLAGSVKAEDICNPISPLRTQPRPGGRKRPLSVRDRASRASIGLTELNRPFTLFLPQNKKESGSDRKNAAFGTDMAQQKAIVINMSHKPEAVTKLVLSLKTMGSFAENNGKVRIGGALLPILPFVRDVVTHYLSHPSSEVRRAAALTCCALLIPFDIPSSGDRQNGVNTFSIDALHVARKRRLGLHTCRVIEEVLSRLLQVAVSDSSSIVRLCLVRALDERYDYFLCQEHHLQPLFFLLHDEALATRAAGLQLLGRLASLNPAPILPVMRQLLINLIVELRCGGDTGRGREEATRLLMVYLRCQPLRRLVLPVLASLVEALPLKGVAPRLASAALEALGELAMASRSSLKPWVKELTPHVMETMLDQSSASMQRVSWKTLGQIAGSTSYVVKPYLEYPKLLSQATDVLPATKRAPWALRREVIRTLGIVGALDPDQYHTFVPKRRKGGAVGGGYFVERENEGRGKDQSGASEPHETLSRPAFALGFSSSTTDQAGVVRFALNPSEEGNFVKEADDDMPAHLYMYEQYAMVAQPISKIHPAQRMIPSDEDFYPTVAIQALTRIFKDASLAVHHGMVMQAIMFIFNFLGLKCVPFLNKVVPHMLFTIRHCTASNLREALLKQVASLSSIVREHLRPYVADIFDIVNEFWKSRHLGTILTLVAKIAVGVPDDFRKFLPMLVRKLLVTLEEIQTSEWFNPAQHETQNPTPVAVEKLELILRSIKSLRGVLGEYLHLLVPALLKLADALLSITDLQSTGTNLRTNESVAITTIRTLAHLIENDKTSTGGRQSSSIPRMEMQADTQLVGSSLPARAAQPLIRLLSRETSSSREVGFAIIEAICVCSLQLGRKRWLLLYSAVARQTICDWSERYGVDSEIEGLESADRRRDSRGTKKNLTGLKLYDSIILDLETTGIQRIASSAGLTLESRRDSFMEARHGSSDPNIGDLPLGALVDMADQTNVDFQTNTPIQPVMHPTSRHRVNQGNLQRAWDVSQRASREDWDEWMRRFAIQLLREAPSPALRATASLAHAYQPLARELFSAAFVCCWEELTEQYRRNLVQALETAFVADVSPDILQTLLNLAEFMEHESVGSGLPIDISNLAELALKCRAYAKALHYKEREYSQGGSSAAYCVEALISINKKLDLPEAALGVLKSVQVKVDSFRPGTSLYASTDTQMTHHLSTLRKDYGEEIQYSVVSSTDDRPTHPVNALGLPEVQESWLAKLGSWTEALSIYEDKLRHNPNNFDAMLGCMRCHDASGEWKRVLELAERSWPAISGGSRPLPETSERQNQGFDSMYVNPKLQKRALKFGAQAAWRLGQWEDLEKYASELVHKGNTSIGSHPTSGTNRDGGPTMIDFDGAFYSAVLHIHRQQWSLAANAIDAARRAMDSRFTALMAESYKRAYSSMVTAQTLAEMEEIIAFRKLEIKAIEGAHRHPMNRPNVHAARQQLLSAWRKRLAGCRVDAEVHSSILAVRSLVLGPMDEVQATLTLSDLSRQAQRYKLAERVLLDPLHSLGADLTGPLFGFGLPPTLNLGLKMGTDPSSASVIDKLVTGTGGTLLPQYDAIHYQFSRRLVEEAGGLERLRIQHHLYFAYVKHLWSLDRREEAMSRTERLCGVVDLTTQCENVADHSLAVACWLELGDYKLDETLAHKATISESLQAEVLFALKQATSAPGCGYRAFHAWALLNFRIAEQLNGSEDVVGRRQRTSTPPSGLKNHVIAAVKGFRNAISLGTKRWTASVQQDLLNLLTCLFKYGELSDVASTINEGMETINLEAWLGVLPQLLARIHIRKPSVRSVLHPLLSRLGAAHPQALMYPLSVLLKSPVVERKSAAESLMTTLKSHSSALVEEALMVSSELIRVAILWLETWHEGLEDASRLYFGEGNVSGMLDLLLPLHEKLEKGAETQKEAEFIKSFGRDLSEAHAYVKEYVRLVASDGGDVPTQASSEESSIQYDRARQSEEAETAMNKAWDIYYTVFRWINKQLPALTKLELVQCSPALSQARNLELGVPGSYRVDGSYVKIQQFIPSVQVITSKQRPRKITLRGSDGKDYMFLLKGHEDLRQDERVMQLFGLVNALLARDRQTKKHDLNIQRYAICPLSHDCGVVGWVPHTDTLHSLIRDYRQTKRIALNMENREMLKVTPDYDLLTVMQKVEVFTDALRRTTGKGNDLYEILWLKSTNSEEWLDRRTKFTRSLAVMSMVGYILGLGDRHPSNLMLDSLSGRVLHIDFGDCFEVAMNREKYPEKIPFRLTRMLIKAMEVSGIEGSYRSTCEKTMTVLRASRDSLVAMLEAFVYDPLISWRLAGLSDGEGSGTMSPGAVVLDAAGHPSTIDRLSDPEQENGVPIDVSKSVLHESIAEGFDEDGDDVEESGQKLERVREHPASLSDKIHQGISAEATMSRDVAVSAAKARSLQMYSKFQTLAANLSTSSRIASIAGEGSERVAAESSIAKSRIARSLRQREVLSLLEGEAGAAHEEALNEKALKVIRRVQDKLSGTDFPDMDEDSDPLDVPDQVQRLIVQATSSENLCQLFIGWCAFW